MKRFLFAAGRLISSRFFPNTLAIAAAWNAGLGVAWYVAQNLPPCSNSNAPIHIYRGTTLTCTALFLLQCVRSLRRVRRRTPPVLLTQTMKGLTIPPRAACGVESQPSIHHKEECHR